MKQKTDFHELKFINPFEPKYVKRMVYPDWSNREVLQKWRVDNSKFLKDPKQVDLLDIDELVTQWDVKPDERKVNPKTAIMLYKELCIVLRLIDAEHQDAMNRECIPGVVQSSRDPSKYLYIEYDLECPDARKATKTKVCDSEFDAYWGYMQNRNTMIESCVTKALNASLIDPDIYDKYFYDLDTIAVRDYEFYKEKQYKEETKEE